MSKTLWAYARKGTFMGKYFGTDGFRGRSGVVLTAEHAFKIGRFLGAYYSKEKGQRAKIVIGKDTRRSSYMYENALAAGITASGSDAYLLHVTTTPCVSYITRTDKFDCGIMISASHNPFVDNGIKLMNGDGEKMEDEVQDLVEEYLDGKTPDPAFATGADIGCTVDYYTGRNRYIGYLISLATRSYKGKRIGLDCSNGSTFNIAKSVFDALGAKTYVIGNEPDGLNINKDCGSTHIENLQKLVKEKELDAGFAFDGDADRCIAVDDNGNVIDGDYILYICGTYLKRQGRLEGNHVVATVMSNLGFFKALELQDVEYDVTTVGDKYVNEDMVAHGYVLGGEQSGHIIFAKHATTGDGILTAIMLMEVMMEEKTSLSALASGMKKYPQLLKNLPVTDKDAVMNHPEVIACQEAITNELRNDGRILLRPSGTEPVIRVMVEAGTDEICKKYVDQMIDKIKELSLA
jgi:phosphoglucosamine mutase